MTKAEIVQKLLDSDSITAEEAVILLSPDSVNIERIVQPVYVPPVETPHYNPPYCEESDMVPYGTYCPCNPANGGSGICGCVMGNKLVPKRRELPYVQLLDGGTGNFNSHGFPTMQIEVIDSK